MLRSLSVMAKEKMKKTLMKAPKTKLIQFKLPKDFAKTVLELEIKLDRREFTLNNLNTLLGLYTVRI